MKERTPAERVKELLAEVLELLLLSESIPDSPRQDITTGQQRRAMRRHADRLRNGEAEVVFKNLYSKKQFIRILENTIRRDEGYEEFDKNFFRLGNALATAMHEDPPGTRIAFDEFFAGVIRKAKEDGPESGAEALRRQLDKLQSIVSMWGKVKRRQKEKRPEKGDRLAFDPSKRIRMIPAEIIDAPLPGETVISFPAEDPFGLERMFIRIGIGNWSWVGNFACGLHYSCTAFMMPNNKHLFVSAAGEGYILDYDARTLVERNGNEIVGTHRNAPMTVFLVIHGGHTLEAFGREGRLWKTERIGSGGIRRIRYTDEEVIGEVWQQDERQWVPFTVNVATGQVQKGAV